MTTGVCVNVAIDERSRLASSRRTRAVAVSPATWLGAVHGLPSRNAHLQPALTVGKMDQVGSARLLGVTGSQRDVDVAMALLGDLECVLLGDRAPQTGAR